MDEESLDLVLQSAADGILGDKIAALIVGRVILTKDDSFKVQVVATHPQVFENIALVLVHLVHIA